jgi:hypothetical protein
MAGTDAQGHDYSIGSIGAGALGTRLILVNK